MHCSPHKHKNRTHAFIAARFSCQEPNLGTIKDYHLDGFFLTTIENCLIGLQQYTLICQTQLARLHLFPRFCKVEVHNSYTAVQSLLYSTYLLCVKPSYQHLSADRCPRITYSRLRCTYLFVAVGGVYFQTIFQCKAVPLLLSSDLIQYAACLNSLQPFRTLHFCLCQSQFSSGGNLTKKNECLDCANMKTENIHISLILCQTTFVPVNLLNETCLWMCST